MTDDDLYDKRRGQRMLLTKWIKAYNATDDEAEKERAAYKLADVLAWARTVGMSPSEIAEDRNLPYRALELFEAGGGVPAEASDAEVRAAESEVLDDVDSSAVTRLGEGHGSVYAYGYRCLPDRLKIGRTSGNVKERISSQINESTPDRPVLHLILETDNPGPPGTRCMAHLVLRERAIKGGGKEWYRTTVAEVVAIYRALLGEQSQE